MSRASEIRLSRVGAACVAFALLVLVLAYGNIGTIAAERASPLPQVPSLIGLVAGGAADFVLDRDRDLERVAAAVDSAESDYGRNPDMWRADPLGPQGPMQVSAAAAADVGGGNRFDVNDNLALGRAYLARMYHHYGSWADAVAAYNWGPTHMDAWISSGRPADQLPAAVERYTGRVMLASSARGMRLPIPNLLALSFASRRPGLVRLQSRLRIVRRIDPHDPVQQLYANVMQASAAQMR
jgi:hypothetical protein